MPCNWDSLILGIRAPSLTLSTVCQPGPAEKEELVSHLVALRGREVLWSVFMGFDLLFSRA